ncbi:TPA: ead/Ea22-like family protein [Citrobacter freundii]|uniref:ead/Ea22-like family protein n=1 Tax=Citrobacter freundii TaxID=546 RepID=UPI003740CE7B|nr:ead/Ea22-like family protein [Citrobacter freundii]
MTALNKQALREAAQEEIMLRSVSDTSDAWQDEASPEAVLELLDENLQLQRDKDSLEAVAVAMRDDMRDAREKLEAAEKRIAEHRKVLNSLAVVARRYLPDYDEQPEIQAADELLESTAGLGVKGE